MKKIPVQATESRGSGDTLDRGSPATIYDGRCKNPRCNRKGLIVYKGLCLDCVVKQSKRKQAKKFGYERT